jgi:hypothetical protein
MYQRQPKQHGTDRIRPALWGPAAVAAALGLVSIVFSAGICSAQYGSSSTTTTTSTSNEPLFIKNLHITGYFLNTTATWINAAAQEYNTDAFGKLNKNALASERQQLQIDINDDFTENDSMFMRLFFVYEPPYPWETGCLNAAGEKVDCSSDFYNQYGIRELWFKHRWGPLQIFVGRQIVTWGESLAFRVADQLNPVDDSFAFGFTDLEQSRIPSWMLHPILNLPSVGPLSSNFLEVVYMPGFDFLYTQVDYPNDSYDGLDNIAGRVDITGEDPGGRFGARTDTRAIVPGPCNALLGPPVNGAGGAGLSATAPPFVLCQVGGPGEAAGQASTYFTSATQTIPSATFGNSVVGVRLHTLIENAELTGFYQWNHDLTPIEKIENQYTSTTLPVGALFPGSPGIFTRRGSLFYPQWQGVGFTANRPLYLPGVLSQLPFVLRFENLYKNHDGFDTFAIPGTVFSASKTVPAFAGVGVRNYSPSGVTRSDVDLWMVALDLDSAYTPWLTTTGNLTANYELFGTTILSYSHNMMGAPGYFEHAYHNDVEMLASVSTSWWWGAIAPDWTTIFDPNGLTFLSFPNITLTPPWTNKYFLKVEWVDVQGTNTFGLDGGVFKGKDLLFAQFQYNFSLL